ncbi:outer membrane protein assembly factor BamB family protein [Schlesneria paludicola]|uniref:outer membrane protein assembly factor BamB family protein n=1 Tax=Schlesneria paludicola TaxID=360056 RepID=UPI00031CC6D6|nr:PQQ-binding-like beta-propeller repeat protein [Schlesneria paludicola]
MTDQDLLRLLQEKSATELTPDEVSSVRSRWRDSAEFRLACGRLPDLVAKLNLGNVLGADHELRGSPMAVVPSSHQARAGAVRSRMFVSVIGIVAGIGLTIWFWMFAPAIVRVGHVLSTKSVHDDVSAPPETADRPNAADRVTGVEENEDTRSALMLQSDSETMPADSTRLRSGTVSGPWTASLAEDASVWSPDSSRWTADYQRSGHDELAESVAKLWLESVEPDSFGLSTELIGKPAHRITRFQGLGKLRAPWPGDAVLRMTPFDVSDLTLLFWTGKTGLAFRFFPHCEPPLWAAYQIVRNDASPRPSRWALVTTDSGAYARSTPGTFDIRHQDQSLVLARGGLILMSGPLTIPPIEVYVSGQFRLRGLTMHRSDPLPMHDDTDQRRIVDGNAAGLSWASVPVGSGHLVSEDDGSVSLVVERGPVEAITSVPFKHLPGLEDAALSGRLSEISARMLSADGGTGFFLGDRDGRPIYQWEFRKGLANEGLVLSPRSESQDARQTDHDSRHGPKSMLVQPIWLKWILGLDQIHVSISGDGRHWGAIAEEYSDRPADEIATFGLFGSSSDDAATIRVNHLCGRELSGLTELFPRELLNRVVVTPADGPIDVSVWKQRVLDQQPDDVDSTEWFIANAVAFVARRPTDEVGREVFEQLLSVAIDSKLSFVRKYKLLHEASMLCDATNNSTAMRMAQRYAELGRQIVEADGSAASFQIRQAVLRGPAWTKNPFQPVCDQLQSHEILCAVYGQDWDTAWTSARAASFWSTLPQPDVHSSERGVELNRHARWAESLVAEYAPQLDDGAANILSPSLRHPLVLSVNKAAYSARAEIQAALSSSNFDEACRIATTTMPDDDQVLLPDASDSAWFVSFGALQKMRLDELPEFRTAMAERYQELGSIRLRAATNQNDLVAVARITQQFLGTDAARDASVWLGDRDLASGQCESAIQRYLDAQQSREGNGHDVVAPRLILARTLAGQSSDTQASAALVELKDASVALNSATLPKTAFEALIRDLGDQRARRHLVDHEERSDQLPLEVRPYALVFRARMDGDFGTDPGRWEFRINDAIGRQLAATSDGRRFYVSNRFQITCYSKDDAETIWSCGLGGEQADSHLLPFIPMKPLVTEHHLFVRRLTKAGPELVCIGLAQGNIVWRQRPSLGVLADPVIWNGRLFTVTATKGDDDLVHVAATWFDDSTGAVTERRELMTLREPVERWYAAQLKFNDRLAICTVAGTTACFDWKGEMKWLRRHLTLRRPVDELADDFRVHAPIVNGQCVIVALPGVREVCCFDLQNGRTVWSRPIADVRGILGASDSRIVVDTPRGLLSLSRESGAPVWFVPIAHRMEMFWLNGTTCAVAHRVDAGGSRSMPVMTWLNVETGARLGQSPIHGDLSEELLSGPLFASSGKFFTFAGRSSKDAKRELYELLPIHGDPSVHTHQGSTKPQ